MLEFIAGINRYLKTQLILVSIALLTLSGCVRSNPVTGYWVGTMEMNGKTVDVSIFFDSKKGFISSRDLLLFEERIGNAEYNEGTVGFVMNSSDARIRFDGSVNNNRITGTAAIEGGTPEMKITFALTKRSDVPPGKSYSIEKITIKNKDVSLSAEIFKPNTKGKHPALVLLHGSSQNFKYTLNFYADYFANLGFETLIFDKRGYGESTGNNVTASYGDLAEDVAACLQTMENRETTNKNKIGLWGVSQGGMLLPFAASVSNIPAFLIAVSPEVVSSVDGAAFSDSIRVRYAGYSSDEGHIAAESQRKVGEMIRSGSDYLEVETFINQNANKYRFMQHTALYDNMTIIKDEFEGFYWQGRKQIFYSYWKNIKLPTLTVLGEDDEVLNAVRNEKLIKDFHNNKILTKLFPGANHGIKVAFNPARNPDFDWPRVIPGYLDFVEKWVRKVVSE